MQPVQERLGLDAQSVFGMPPLDYVTLAAELGCSHLTTGLGPPPWNPCRFPAWSLRASALLRREMRDLMRDRGVRISVLYGFAIRPGLELTTLAGDMDLAVELGSRFVGTVGMEPDLARAHDQLALLTGMAVERGLQVVLDYAPHHPIDTLGAATRALRHTGSPHALLSMDAMHFFRAGGTIAELAALDPGLVGYAQVCDVPRKALHPDYAKEATFERLMPGDGELPLVEFVAALPPEVLIGVEAPNRVGAETDLRGFLAAAVAASRQLVRDAAPIAGAQSAKL